MPLIYAGIDEAGYGPLLGPLCVGMSVFQLDEWTPENGGDKAPDLWKAMSTGVCRKPGDRRRRVAVDDSKKLKLPNDSPNAHPLTHLERGVLSFLGLLASSEAGLPVSCPEHDAALFHALGVSMPGETWYTDPSEPLGCPSATTADAIAISTNMLRLAADRAGVTVLGMRCHAMGETTFNDLVKAAGNKTAATEAALIEHLWMVWDRWGAVGARPGGGVRVVCDRQGGRAYYTELLQRAFPGAMVVETHHSEMQSRYEVSVEPSPPEQPEARHMHVLFLVESERQHLPVALASMLAKLTREMFMARFNRYWCGRMKELKPTAGYRNDAWRWLEEAKVVIGDEERVAMIRRA